MPTLAAPRLPCEEVILPATLPSLLHKCLQYLALARALALRHDLGRRDSYSVHPGKKWEMVFAWKSGGCLFSSSHELS